MKNIRVDCDILEMMIFFWESVATKDKMADEYFIAIANKPQMKPLYNETFSPDSVRKVLSAISNRERLNDRSKAESVFWNNNMWMLEDLTVMQNMLHPVKTLNLAELVTKNEEHFNCTELEVVFIPGHTEEFYLTKNRLYINFFKLMPDSMNLEKITIAGLSVKNYVSKKVEDHFVK